MTNSDTLSFFLLISFRLFMFISLFLRLIKNLMELQITTSHMKLGCVESIRHILSIQLDGFFSFVLLLHFAENKNSVLICT